MYVEVPLLSSVRYWNQFVSVPKYLQSSFEDLHHQSAIQIKPNLSYTYPITVFQLALTLLQLRKELCARIFRFVENVMIKNEWQKTLFLFPVLRIVWVVLYR
jgi:hypothetical protein